MKDTFTNRYVKAFDKTVIFITHFIDPLLLEYQTVLCEYR